jgi:hypothetical protein
MNKGHLWILDLGRHFILILTHMEKYFEVPSLKNKEGSWQLAPLEQFLIASTMLALPSCVIMKAERHSLTHYDYSMCFYLVKT